MRSLEVRAFADPASSVVHHLHLSRRNGCTNFLVRLSLSEDASIADRAAAVLAAMCGEASRGETDRTETIEGLKVTLHELAYVQVGVGFKARLQFARSQLIWLDLVLSVCTRVNDREGRSAREGARRARARLRDGSRGNRLWPSWRSICGYAWHAS